MCLPSDTTMHSPRMHPNHAPQPCTPNIHPNHAPQSTHPTMHPNHASQPCTPTMHPNHAFQPCTPSTHPNMHPKTCDKGKDDSFCGHTWQICRGPVLALLKIDSAHTLFNYTWPIAISYNCVFCVIWVVCRCFNIAMVGANSQSSWLARVVKFCFFSPAGQGCFGTALGF